jgi:riboflavin synthase
VFTGLVESMGRIAAARPTRSGRRLDVSLPWPVKEGESVAVSGVCLTVARQKSEVAGRTSHVARHRSPVASFDVIPETLARTTLGRLKGGDLVNLERPLRAGDRLGGHFVQGHVDGTGAVAEVRRAKRATVVRIGVAPELARRMVPKGSIAVDGVSLTLVDVGPDFFTVALIPVTLRVTTLGKARRGTRVNVELDVLGKYVEKLAGARRGGVTKELLERAGFA